MQLKKEDVKNCYKKFSSEREEKLYDDLLEFLVERKMTVAEMKTLFDEMAYSVNHAAATIRNQIGF